MAENPYIIGIRYLPTCVCVCVYIYITTQSYTLSVFQDMEVRVCHILTERSLVGSSLHARMPSSVERNIISCQALSYKHVRTDSHTTSRRSTQRILKDGCSAKPSVGQSRHYRASNEARVVFCCYVLFCSSSRLSRRHLFEVKWQRHRWLGGRLWGWVWRWVGGRVKICKMV